MGIRSLNSNHIVFVWIGAIVLAFGAVRIGDALRTSEGDAVGFYIGSLFVWLIWIAWLVTWRWYEIRKSESKDNRWRWLQNILIIFGVIWFLATVFEYL